MQHVYSIFAFNSVLCWITCRSNQFLIFVPDNQEKMNSLISSAIYCINSVDFYIQVLFTVVCTLSINLLYWHRVFSSMYGWIYTGP